MVEMLIQLVRLDACLAKHFTAAEPWKPQAVIAYPSLQLHWHVCMSASLLCVRAAGVRERRQHVNSHQYIDKRRGHSNSSGLCFCPGESHAMKGQQPSLQLTP